MSVPGAPARPRSRLPAFPPANVSVPGSETETWQCLLCVNFAELPEEEAQAGGALTPRQQKLMERVTLELYCQYELSLSLREAAPERPSLDAIRARLQPSAPQRYRHVHTFVADCRLLFRTACRLFPVPVHPIET